MKGHCDLTLHAFGKRRSAHKRIISKFVGTDYTLDRKTRSGIGKTVFNCDKKRKWTFTPLNVYKKRKNREFHETTERLSAQLLKDEFSNLPEDEKRAYETIADCDYQLSLHLWDELKQLLIKTKGKISYRSMSDQLDNIVSAEAIRTWLQQQDGFHVRRDRVLPSLDKQAKGRRLKWSHDFWVFWYFVRYVKKEKALFVLTHMDEKWFYAVRTRANCKVLTSIGLEPFHYRAHHRNHIGKEMYVVVTAYVLNENDITGGETAVPVSLVRVGKMVKAKKDSFKRVYDENGAYTYPKNPENILLKKGELYFKSFDLTGSKEGTSKKPKISLLNIYKEHIIPDLEEKVVKKYNENGTRKIIVVKQEDGAGLHQDKTYICEMTEIFEKKNWIIFNQPSQSPVTNVHDACIFPMLCKMVSKAQALHYGRILLKGEELYHTDKTAWDDPSNRAAMSRAFAGHHQVVCVIVEHEGDNKYLSKKGGLSFGIRVSYCMLCPLIFWKN